MIVKIPDSSGGFASTVVSLELFDWWQSTFSILPHDLLLFSDLLNRILILLQILVQTIVYIANLRTHLEKKYNIREIRLS